MSELQSDELIARIQEGLSDDDSIYQKAEYTYFLRDDFLSSAELNFYRVLQTAVSDWATIFVKVSLGDLFFAKTGERGRNTSYRNKIDRKHVDFLLCDPLSVHPLLGIERVVHQTSFAGQQVGWTTRSAPNLPNKLCSAHH